MTQILHITTPPPTLHQYPQHPSRQSLPPYITAPPPSFYSFPLHVSSAPPSHHSLPPYITVLPSHQSPPYNQVLFISQFPPIQSPSHRSPSPLHHSPPFTLQLPFTSVSSVPPSHHSLLSYIMPKPLLQSSPLPITVPPMHHSSLLIAALPPYITAPSYIKFRPSFHSPLYIKHPLPITSPPLQFYITQKPEGWRCDRSGQRLELVCELLLWLPHILETNHPFVKIEKVGSSWLQCS